MPTNEIRANLLDVCTTKIFLPGAKLAPGLFF